MCDNHCEELETLNPEIEYQKFLKRKPVVLTPKYESLLKPASIKCSNNAKGYGMDYERNHNILYRTSNSEYGLHAPNQYTISTRYFPLSQQFSRERAHFGMYRNYSLNTEMDRLSCKV